MNTETKTGTEPIEIVVCTDDKYVLPTGVLFTSLFVTNRDSALHIHVVYESLSEESRKTLESCVYAAACSGMENKIDFYHIDKDLLKSCPVRPQDHITLATYFRILFPSILPTSIDKILYLDGDIVCVDSLASVWNTNLDGYAAGVIPDIYSDDIRRFNRLHLSPFSGYFNAGVMLINLDYWRSHHIEKKTMEYITQHADRCIAHDQDALNYTLSGQTLYIHPRYDVQLDFFGNKNNLLMDKKYFPDIDEAINSPCLLHFTGAEKPWHFECVYPLKDVWLAVLKKTQWKGLKLVHKYSGKRLFKYYVRTLLVKLRLVADHNPYKKKRFEETAATLITKFQ